MSCIQKLIPQAPYMFLLFEESKFPSLQQVYQRSVQEFEIHEIDLFLFIRTFYCLEGNEYRFLIDIDIYNTIL